jgi:N-acetylglutamate synthase-like GNAT family acetyltransferase
MEVRKATKKDVKQISRMMLSDLKNPHSNFPKEMIKRFREHAKEKNIKKEFENPSLMVFLILEESNVVGFIAGYKENQDRAMIHYITAKNKEQKKELLDVFIRECQTKKIDNIITDTFEFMENNNFFKSNGFKLIKKEKVTEKLEMLWYGLKFIRDI